MPKVHRGNGSPRQRKAWARIHIKQARAYARLNRPYRPSRNEFGRMLDKALEILVANIKGRNHG